MVFEKSVLVDLKIFTFSVVKEGLLHITESRKVKKLVIIGKVTTRWLEKTVVACVDSGDCDFHKTSLEGN